jgi:hypothetical protein
MSYRRFDASLVTAIVGDNEGTTVGLLLGFTVGREDGMLDRVLDGASLGPPAADTPPPHAQHDVFAVCPKFAASFPNKLHMSSAAYHVHV